MLRLSAKYQRYFSPVFTFFQPLWLITSCLDSLEVLSTVQSGFNRRQCLCNYTGITQEVLAVNHEIPQSWWSFPAADIRTCYLFSTSWAHHTVSQIRFYKHFSDLILSSLFLCNVSVRASWYQWTYINYLLSVIKGIRVRGVFWCSNNTVVVVPFTSCRDRHA
jgi:hypothetical protein